MNPKIILEGTDYTFRTAISILLNEHPKIVGERKISKNHSPTLATEWNAFTRFQDGKSVINFSEDELDEAIYLYKTWLNLFEMQQNRFWVIDGFHLSTKVYQEIHNKIDFEVNWIEEKLKELDFKLVLCQRKKDTFRSAIEQEKKISSNEIDLKIQSLQKEQDFFEKFFEQSRLSKLVVDVSHGNFKKSAKEIANWVVENQK